jgi:hypothetical protein
MSNTPIVNLLKSVKTMSVFDIVMEKPAEVRWSDGCVSYSQGKTCWSQSKRWVCLMGVFDIVMEKPAEVSRGDGCAPRLTSAGFSMTISNTPIASTDFSRFCHDYIKHTPRLDWLQQVFPWLYQTHPSPQLTSPGFSMTSQDDGYVWYSHGKTCWSQSRRWVCLI